MTLIDFQNSACSLPISMVTPVGGCNVNMVPVGVEITEEGVYVLMQIGSLDVADEEEEVHSYEFDERRPVIKVRYEDVKDFIVT
jgi:hypothetical protein